MPNPPSARDVKPFVGSREFDLSRDFYVALGWRLNFETSGLAELELGGARFYLQRFYSKDWCENSMLYIPVDDAAAWFDHVERVLEDDRFAPARVQPPAVQEHGAIVTYVWDPSGILLHFAQDLA